ncbi:hypothetical protein [Streptomyces globosus]
MQSHNNTPGQNLPEITYLPVPAPKALPQPPRLTPLRAWWNTAWEEGGP